MVHGIQHCNVTTLELEVRESEIQVHPQLEDKSGQPGLHEILSQSKNKTFNQNLKKKRKRFKLGVMEHTCNLSTKKWREEV